MKFYFCETCGKRLTEHDITEGVARDKKLKGVFCKECALGITTMDTLPMDDAEARKTLDKEAGKQPSKRRTTGNLDLRKLQKTTSSKRVAPARRERVSGHSAAATPPGGPLLVGIGVGIVGVVLLAGFWLMSGSDPQTGNRGTATQKKEAKPAGTDPSPGRLASSEPAKPDGKATQPESRTEDNEQSARDAFELLARFEGLDPADTETRLGRVEEFLRTHGTAKVADEARALRDKLKATIEAAQQTQAAKVAEPETPDTTSPTPPDQDAKKPPPTETAKKPETEPKKPDPAETQRAALNRLLEAFIEALGKDDLDSAHEAVTAAEAATEPKSQLLGAIKAFKTQKQSFVKALANLKGKQVVLPKLKGPSLKGTVTKVDADGLWVARTYVINGQERQAPAAKVLISELASSARERIYPTPKPANADEWIHKALIAVASMDSVAATKALDSSKGHVLEVPLRELFTRIQREAREENARSAWKSIHEASEKKLDLKAAKQLVSMLTQFETDHGKTVFATSEEHVQERKKLKKLLERVALGLDPRIIKLFKGQIESYDARTQEITIRYNLANKLHHQDFWLAPHDGTGGRQLIRKQKDGIKLSHRGIHGLAMSLPQFQASHVSIKVHYKDLHGGRSHTRVTVFFRASGSKGTTRRVNGFFYDNTVLFAGPDHRTGPDRQTFKSASLPEKLPSSGTFTYACKGRRYSIGLNDSILLEYDAKEVNDRRGISLGGGWGTSYIVTSIEATGRLDAEWLKQKLGDK